MELRFQAQAKIQKPVANVFAAVYEPEKLSAFFTNGGASGPLDAGTTIEWRFADTPGEEPLVGEVNVKEMKPNALIVFEWMGGADHRTRVEMNFEVTGDAETLVRISETGWRETQEDLDRSYGNCFGWSYFVLGLKAFVEYGVNLRKGAFTGLYSTKNKVD